MSRSKYEQKLESNLFSLSFNNNPHTRFARSPVNKMTQSLAMQHAFKSTRALHTEISAEDPVGKKANHSARVSFLSENASSGSDNPRTTIGLH